MYCSAMHGCLVYLSQLLRVQNAAAHLLMVLPVCTQSRMHWFDYIGCQLCRIRFKPALRMYLMFTNKCPRYISDDVSHIDSASPCGRLRSSSSRFSVSRTRTKLDWNNLLQSVLDANTIALFQTTA